MMKEKMSRIVLYLGKALDRAVVNDEPTEELQSLYSEALDVSVYVGDCEEQENENTDD